MRQDGKALFSAALAAVLINLLASCGSFGDSVDGFTTERVELYSGNETTADPHVPDAAQNELYKRVKEYFGSYYGETEHTVSFDPAERGSYGGDECYIFRSYTSDGAEGFLIAASVDGKNVYGYQPSTELQGLIWCEGWDAPDFSYFGEKDMSGL